MIVHNVNGFLLVQDGDVFSLQSSGDGQVLLEAVTPQEALAVSHGCNVIRETLTGSGSKELVADMMRGEIDAIVPPPPPPVSPATAS